MTRLPFLPPSAACAPQTLTLARRRAAAGRTSAMSAPPAPPYSAEYPSPLSPPYPAISKDVELRRATTASSRSAAFSSAAAAVVFEDQWLAVVDKPAGVYCEALLSSLPSSNAGDSATQSNLHLANRLDRDTSGLMVITKCNKAAGKLVKAFTDHKVKKTYLALCLGHIPTWEKIKISSGHGRSKFGAWRVYSMADVGRTLPGGSTVRDMSTTFDVLGINGRGQFREPSDLDVDGVESIIVQEKAISQTADGDNRKHDDILVRAYPQSGRTHQIRLHCQYLGLSIRGDVKYGGVHEWKGVAFNEHALHAESLSFVHPITGLHVTFGAPLPSWANEFISTMGKGS